MNGAGALFGALTAGTGFTSLYTSRRAWTAIDTPTIPTGHLVIGHVEVKGRAAVAPGCMPVVSPFSAETCVYWKAELQHHSGGKEKSWKTVHTAKLDGWIEVDDGSGPVLVSLAHALPRSLDSSTFDADDAPSTLSGVDLDRLARGEPFMPGMNAGSSRSLVDRLISAVAYDRDTPIATLGGDWRVVETRIPVGGELYVYGQTSYDDERHRAVIGGAPKSNVFVYAGSEKVLTRNARLIALGAFVAALVFAYLTVSISAGTATRIAGSQKVHPNWRAGTLGPWALLLGAVVAQGIRIRNRIVKTGEQVVAARRLVDIALSKRATLIPQLVEVVKASAAHERGVQEAVAALRADAATGPAVALLAERSPTLTANTNFLSLQRTLADVETDVAVANAFVVDAELAHKNRITTFPDKWFAPLAATSP